MSWGILAGTLSRGGKGAVFYETTTGSAFGPILESVKDAESFAAFLGGDPRSVGSDAKMEKQFHRYRQLHPRKETGRRALLTSASSPKRRRRRP
jgi:hypothetical protein